MDRGILPAPIQAMPQTWQVATFVRRVAAFVIDAVVLVAWYFVTVLVLGSALAIRGLLRPNPYAPLNAVDIFFRDLIAYGGLAVSALIVVLYFVLGWQHAGTIGMQVLKLRVVRIRDGDRITLAASVIRLVAGLLSAVPLGLGLIRASWDPRSQGWHDRLAGTVVWHRLK